MLLQLRTEIPNRQPEGGNGRGSNFAKIIETNEADCFCFADILTAPTIYYDQKVNLLYRPSFFKA